MEIKKFFRNFGVATSQELTEDGLLELKKEAQWMVLTNQKDREALIYDFFERFDSLYLKDWERYYPLHKDLEPEIYEKIKTFVYSINIEYQDQSKGFEYSIDENFIGFYEGVDLDKEQKVIEFLSPGWELTSIFLEEQSKFEYAVELSINAVKEIIEKANLFNKMYNKLPELLKEEKNDIEEN